MTYEELHAKMFKEFYEKHRLLEELKYKHGKLLGTAYLSPGPVGLRGGVSTYEIMVCNLACEREIVQYKTWIEELELISADHPDDMFNGYQAAIEKIRNEGGVQ